MILDSVAGIRRHSIGPNGGRDDGDFTRGEGGVPSRLRRADGCRGLPRVGGMVQESAASPGADY